MGLSGLFLGTYSAVPYAALCRVVQRVRPVRCAFAVESSVEMAVHRAAQGMPYGVALLMQGRAVTVRARIIRRGVAAIRRNEVEPPSESTCHGAARTCVYHAIVSLPV